MTDLPAPAKEPKLTLKQRKWLKLYFETGNATQAALQAYETDDPKAASVIGTENLAKLRNPVRTLMELRGLSLGRLLDVLDEGLRANKTIAAQVLVKQDGAVIKKEDEGVIEVEDHPTRHKYLETAARWLGMEGEKGHSASLELSDGDKRIVFKISRGE